MHRLGLALIVASLSGATRPPEPILAEDFDGPDSAAHVALFHSPLVALVAGEGVGHSRALRVTYAGNAHGSERVVGVMPLPVPGIERTLAYDVRFDRDFQFVLGGKLHGLGIASPGFGR